MSADRVRAEQLRAELAAARAELNAHMASWEYALANAGVRDGSAAHPRHWMTHARTERLVVRCRTLRAQLDEFDL